MEPSNRRLRDTTASTDPEPSRASRITRRVIGLMLLATFFLPTAAKAEEPAANGTMPHCGQPMDGQVFCNSGVLYECEFVSPNSMERRTGWRWKSDLLRSCPDPERVKPRPPIYERPPLIHERPPEDCIRERRDQPDDDDAATAPAGPSEPRTINIRPDRCRRYP